mgnify:CR=1 FL=1
MSKLNMSKLRFFLKKLEGLTVEIGTEYGPVSGVLVEVEFDYVVLRTNNNLVYVPLASIQYINYLK